MLSVVIPARNEELAIQATIEKTRAALEKDHVEHEIIVIDDGSTDRTGDIARAAGATVVRHPASGGYGRSLKDGMALARYNLIGIADADGTYPVDRLPELYHLVRQDGFDMAVGARTGAEYRGTFLKMPARKMFLWLSEYATGRKIDDINSGLRVFRKDLVTNYLHTISDGFSFTTTVTLAFMLNGHFVTYVPIEYFKRIGASHVRYWRDTKRSLQIIIENILYYNPLKLFLLLISALFLIALSSAVTLVFTTAPKAAAFLALLSAGCVSAIFVTAAVGLGADLARFLHHRDASRRNLPGREPPGERAPPFDGPH